MSTATIDESLLAPQQARVLAYFREHQAAHGYPPTRRELCAALGWSSPNAAGYPLRRLVKKGLLVRDGRCRSRCFRLADEPADVVPIATGAPTLTARQAQILRWIATSTAERGVPPSYREIGDAMGIGSPNAIQEHLAALVKKGYLASRPRRSRTLIVLQLPPEDLA